MKNKWYFMTFLMIAGFIGLLFLSSAIGNAAVTTLEEEFPALSGAAGFEGTLIWDEKAVRARCGGYRYTAGRARYRYAFR